MDNNRYEKSPMSIFFENFVLATINKLPEDKTAKLNSIDLSRIFNTETKDWKIVVKQVLHLSETIEIAILDLWYKNQELAAQRNVEYHPNQFAIDFVDNFLKEGSRIDIWTGDSLEEAKKRIKQFQQGDI